MTPKTKKKAPAKGMGKKGEPASPGLRPKYRMLEEGERKKKGDQFKDFDGKWRAVVFVGEQYSAIWDEPVRRLVSPKGSAKAAGRSRPKASPQSSPKAPPKSKRGAK